MKKLLSLSCAIGLLFQNTAILAQECSHITGNWRVVINNSIDRAWVYLSQFPNNPVITGSADPDLCAPGWLVNGTYNGSTGQYSYTATNPYNPDYYYFCNPSVTVTGDLQEPNCDNAPGTIAGTTVPVAMTKFCDIPIGEATVLDGWGSWWPPIPGTIGRWKDIPIPFTGLLTFGGRVVTETQSAPGNDTCYYDGALAGQPQDHITGGSWTVGADNTWRYDFVGWGPAIVDDYRDYYGPGIDCHSTVPQEMVMSCTGPDPNYAAYSGRI